MVSALGDERENCSSEIIYFEVGMNFNEKTGKVAIVYCSFNDFPIEPGLESIPDSEEEEIAIAVKEALEAQDFEADILAIHPDRLEQLAEYTWIFNLVESIVGYDDLTYRIVCGMEDLGLRFTGSCARTLWLCQEKSKAKQILLENGILTPAYTVIKPGQAIKTEIAFPLFVKPLQLDSHIGVTVNSLVHTPAELDMKVKEIHRLYRQPALVEEYIEGRDINAAVLGNGTALQVLPLSEMVFLPGFIGPKVLTYEATWVEGSIAYANNMSVCPCSLSDRTRDSIIAMARDSYNALGCWDYARIDFRLNGETPYVLEVNPNPCLNPEFAGFIVSCQVAGMDYSTAIYKILESSMHRYAQPASRSQDANRVSDHLTFEVSQKIA